MATASPAPAPSPAPTPAPTAQVVGNAFVEQYYHILHQSPELVFRFYQDSSVLSRPGLDGAMTSVSTMKAINDKILSLEYKDYKAEIKTVDAQDSFKGGVVVLVTGCLTGKDNVGKKFTQSFFLAPQDKGYFVLNDVFRYVDENELLEAAPVLVNGTSESITTAPMTSDPEPIHVHDHPVPDPVTPVVEEGLNNGEEVHEPSEHEEALAVEEEAVQEPPVQSVQNEARPVAEPVASAVHEDAPKQSYAAIVTRTPGYVAAKTVKGTTPATAGQKRPTVVQKKPAPPPAAPAGAHEASGPSSNNASENSNAHEEVEGYSIHVRNLPLTVSVAQVEEEFKKFGPIKPHGVQVRSQKGYCYGFVEFEKLTSMQSAIEASSITIAGRQAFIEEKKTTTRAGSGRGRFPPGRGGFRSDFRGRGNYAGGRGYGRSDFGNHGDFSGRRGPSGRGGEGYQRVDQNGNGRVGGRGGMNQTAVSA